MNIQNLTLAALTAIRNDLNGTPDAPRFKVSREKALESVQKLAKAKGIALSKAYDDNGQRVPEPKPAKAKGKKGKAEKAERGPVIRKVAEELLLQVVGKDGDGRPQGRPYSDILDAIHTQFPGSHTSVACLRWYAVRMRERGEKVPNRPRAKPEAADEAAQA